MVKLPNIKNSCKSTNLGFSPSWRAVLFLNECDKQMAKTCLIVLHDTKLNCHVQVWWLIKNIHVHVLVNLKNVFKCEFMSL